MTIWQRVLLALGYAPPTRLEFNADEEAAAEFADYC